MIVTRKYKRIVLLLREATHQLHSLKFKKIPLLRDKLHNSKDKTIKVLLRSLVTMNSFEKKFNVRQQAMLSLLTKEKTGMTSFLDSAKHNMNIIENPFYTQGFS